MQTIFLAAKHDWVSVRGAKIPRALYPFKNETVLSELPRRLAGLPNNHGIHIVTNSPMLSHFQKWRDSLNGVSVEIEIHDNGSQGSDAKHGAVDDLLHVIDKLDLEDDLFVLGGSNWFTFDTNEFLAKSLNRSPAVLLSRRPVEDESKRFGMAKIASDGRILVFNEKKPSPDEAGFHKAGCSYSYSSEQIELFRAFQAEQSSSTSTGDLFAWIAERVPAAGVLMTPSLNGPDFIELHSILWRLVGDPDSWLASAITKFEKASSLHDLAELLDDPDPNVRIFAAHLLGKTPRLFGKTGREHAIAALLEKLGDTASNQIGGADDDDEEIFFVCATAADSLAALGYSDSRDAVFEKAAKNGVKVEPKRNVTV
ncbi:MAG: hypothetical protein ACI8UO_003445 [Verrucomicrobiales bacterium]|jgi:hypothetical protein